MSQLSLAILALLFTIVISLFHSKIKKNLACARPLPISVKCKLPYNFVGHHFILKKGWHQQQILFLDVFDIGRID